MSPWFRLTVWLIAGFVTCTAFCESSNPSATAAVLFPKEEIRMEPTPAHVGEDAPSAATADSLAAIEERLNTIELRLGTATRQPTFTTTFERRLADIEKRLEKVERQLNQVRQLEQRVRKLEVQR